VRAAAGPVYLSVTTGLDAATLGRADRHRAARVLRGAGLFVAGFSAVFVTLGMSATAVGALLARLQVPLSRAGGAVVLLLAVVLLAGTSDRIPGLAREWRLRPRLVGRPVVVAPAAGAAFAFGWTPCIGPVLGSVLAIAAGQDTVLRGAVLLGTYSAGLAVPLLVTGLVFDRLVGALHWASRHGRALTRATAVLLACYGVLLLTGSLARLTAALQPTVVPPG
jgi:cytochrome c-type biogenesis protein